MLGIRIVNPLIYSIPRVIITCAYMLIISFMVLIALESRAFCVGIRSLWSRETNCRVNHDLQKKAWCLERCNNKQPIWLLDFSVVNWGFYMGFEGSMYMMLPGWSHRVDSMMDMGLRLLRVKVLKTWRHPLLFFICMQNIQLEVLQNEEDVC